LTWLYALSDPANVQELIRVNLEDRQYFFKATLPHSLDPRTLHQAIDGILTAIA